MTKKEKKSESVMFFFFTEKSFPETIYGFILKDYNSWKLLSIPSGELVVALDVQAGLCRLLLLRPGLGSVLKDG